MGSGPMSTGTLRASLDGLEAVDLSSLEPAELTDSVSMLRAGMCLNLAAQVERAAATLLMAHEMALAEEEPAVVMMAAKELVSAYGRIGDLEAAELWSDRALQCAREQGDRGTECVVLANKGMVYGLRGEAERYAEYTRQALALTLELGDQRKTAHNRINLAGALLRLGQLDEAEQLYAQATQTAQQQGWREGLALCLNGQHEIGVRRGELTTADDYAEQSAALLRETGNMYQLARHSALQAVLFEEVGEPARAIDGYAAAEDVASSNSFHALAADAAEGLARLHEKRGDLAGALAALKRAGTARAAYHRQRAAERSLVLDYQTALQVARREGRLASEHAQELEAANADLRCAQQTLQEMVDDKDLLLRELHHRVKNNLQLVSSLLRLQGARVGTETAREAFGQCEARVEAIAGLHRQLSRRQVVSQVDLSAYLEQLVQTHAVSFGPSVRLVSETCVLSLSVGRAVSVGLIVNELVMNAFKYGLERRSPVGYAGADADIRLSMERVGDEVFVRVADSGAGMSRSGEGQGLGMSLMEALCRQLRGTLAFETGDGTRVTLSFPV